MGPFRERRRRQLLTAYDGFGRILVVTPVFGVGNLVLLSGLLMNLRRLCPRATVTLAVPEAGHVRSVIGPELAEEIVAFDGRSPRRTMLLAWRVLRRRHFDLGIATFFMPARLAAAFLALAGCRHRIAYGRTDDSNWLNTVTCLDRGGHELDRHLGLLVFAGRELVRSTRLVPRADASAWADDVVAPWLGTGGTRIVGLHPGCEPVNRQKRWPAPAFGALARQLLATDDRGVLVFLGPGEVDLLPALDLPDSSRVHVVRDVALERVIALVARCHAFVSNDSGLMHVAAALGVPVAAIFGPTPIDKNAPVGRAIIVERAGVWCRPCWQGPPLVCHRERRYCLEDITVEDVLAAVRSLSVPAAANASVPPRPGEGTR
jgi:heptosyltransferase-2